MPNRQQEKTRLSKGEKHRSTYMRNGENLKAYAEKKNRKSVGMVSLGRLGGEGGRLVALGWRTGGKERLYRKGHRHRDVEGKRKISG